MGNVSAWGGSEAVTLDAAVVDRDQSGSWQAVPCRYGKRAGLIVTIAVTSLVLLPLVGLLIPIGHGLPLRRAWQEGLRTAGNTLLYGAGSGLLATLVAWPLAVWTVRKASRRRFMLGDMLALPPALSALIWIRLANTAPPALDGVFRGPAAVILVLAWRLLPVAFVFVMRRWTAFSSSWTMTAAVHRERPFAFSGVRRDSRQRHWNGLGEIALGKSCHRFTLSYPRSTCATAVRAEFDQRGTIARIIQAIRHPFGARVRRIRQRARVGEPDRRDGGDCGRPARTRRPSFARCGGA